MTIIDSIQEVLGVFPPEYEFLLYAGALLFFVLFMQWIFSTLSRLLLDYVLGRRK